jgi:hypothetical protein
MPENAFLNSDTDKRLAIIVPYRDRLEHLKQLIPHLINYFERDKIDRNISVTIHIVEQLGDQEFNRGKLCNCGVSLSQSDADYFCFHDVDYLPIWSDYSYCETPTHLIWHGLPIMDHYNKFFGAVTMFNKADFEKTNGFSNKYWGWGYEDEELRERCGTVGLSIERREGTYQSLPHENVGYNSDGKHNPIATRNLNLCKKRLKNLKELMSKDGLNSLDYRLDGTSKIKIDSKIYENVFLHKVEI